MAKGCDRVSFKQCASVKLFPNVDHPQVTLQVEAKSTPSLCFTHTSYLHTLLKSDNYYRNPTLLKDSEFLKI